MFIWWKMGQKYKSGKTPTVGFKTNVRPYIWTYMARLGKANVWLYIDIYGRTLGGQCPAINGQVWLDFGPMFGRIFIEQKRNVIPSISARNYFPITDHITVYSDSAMEFTFGFLSYISNRKWSAFGCNPFQGHPARHKESQAGYLIRACVTIRK